MKNNIIALFLLSTIVHAEAALKDDLPEKLSLYDTIISDESQARRIANRVFLKNMDSRVSAIAFWEVSIIEADRVISGFCMKGDQLWEARLKDKDGLVVNIWINPDTVETYYSYVRNAEKEFMEQHAAGLSLRIEGTEVSEQNAAKDIAFDGYVKKMRAQILSTESVQNISVITLGYDVPKFALKGDRLWEARVMTIEQELRAIIWVNPKTKAVHFVCGPWDAEEYSVSVLRVSRNI